MLTVCIGNLFVMYGMYWRLGHGITHSSDMAEPAGSVGWCDLGPRASGLNVEALRGVAHGIFVSLYKETDIGLEIGAVRGLRVVGGQRRVLGRALREAVSFRGRN